jgi:hypothetical protein
MPWKEQERFDCRSCGRRRKPDERFSARGKCRDCGLDRCVDNALQLHEHDGPHFDHWRRQCAAAFGAVLLDDA